MPTKDFRPKCRLELSFVHEDFFKIDTHKIQRFETTVAALSRYFFKKELIIHGLNCALEATNDIEIETN